MPADYEAQANEPMELKSVEITSVHDGEVQDEPSKADASPKSKSKMQVQIQAIEPKPEGEGGNRLYNLMQKVSMKKAKTARKFLWEAILYVLFLIVFIVVTDVSRPSWTFLMSDVMDLSVFKNTYQTDKDYTGMLNAFDFWNWMEVILLPELHPTEYTTGVPLDAEEREYSNVYNYVVGRMQMRQVRTQAGEERNNDVCIISHRFDFVIERCYPEWHWWTQDHNDFGPTELAITAGNQTIDLSSAFRYKTYWELCPNGPGCPGLHTGHKGHIYPGDGFAWAFSRDLATAQKEMQTLKENDWLDYKTRAVFVYWTLYNPNVRMLTTCQCKIEFFPTGQAVPTYSIAPLQLNQWDIAGDVVVFVAECILILAVGLYLIYEMWEFRTYWVTTPEQCTVCQMKKIIDEGLDHACPCSECGRVFNQFRFPNCPSCLNEVPDAHHCWRGYFQDPWNYVDICNQAFFIGTFYCRLSVRITLASLDFNIGDEYLNFSGIGFTYSLGYWLSSVNCLLCFIKLFKYLDKVKALSVLVRTFSQAKGEILYFLIIFVVVYIGYAMAFHLAFGTEEWQYKDFTSSLITLFLMMMGDFDFPALLRANRYLGPTFFITYQLLITLILTNMFIAIISGAFGASKEAAANARENFLSSSLIIYFQELRFKLTECGILPRNRALMQIKRLIDSFLRSPHMTEAQMDDIRTFKTEVDHHPNNTELFNCILRNFDYVVDKDMKSKDFKRLKDSVLYWRKHKPKLRVKVWDADGDSDEERRDSAELLGGDERMLQMMNPDPYVDVQQSFMRMHQDVSQGGLLQSKRVLMRKYTEVFTGTEATDWVQTNIYARRPRKDCVELLSYWGKKGFIEHVHLEYPFLDQPKLLYRIVPLKVAEEANQLPPPEQKGIDLLQDIMMRRKEEAMHVGTRMLVTRIKKLDQKVGNLFEVCSQLDEMFDDILHPDLHGLRGLKLVVEYASDLNVEESMFNSIESTLSVYAGGEHVWKTQPRKGTSPVWNDELVVKVRKINEIRFVVENKDSKDESGLIGTGSILVDKALEAELQQNTAGVSKTIELTKQDQPAGKVVVRIVNRQFTNFRELASAITGRQRKTTQERIEQLGELTAKSKGKGKAGTPKKH
jgi:hypothetical protein